MTGLYLLLATGLVLLGLGWLVPAQVRSTPPVVLAAAARDTPSLIQLGEDLLREGRPGSAGLVAQAAEGLDLPGAAGLKRRVLERKEESIDLKVFGQWEPLLDQVFTAEQAQAAAEREGFVSQMLRPEIRHSAARLLANSRNPSVQRILETRGVTEWRQFMPVGSAAGQPLEAVILTTALLAQASQFSAGVANSLDAAVAEALAEGRAARLELFYLDLLTLGRRLPWSGLVDLTRRVDDLDGFSLVRHALQNSEAGLPLVYAAGMATGDPAAVAGYLHEYGRDAVEGLRLAAAEGTGAIRLLVKRNVPVSGLEADRRPPPEWWHGLTARLAPLAADLPLVALLLRYAFFLGAAASLMAVLDRLLGFSYSSIRGTFSPTKAGIFRGSGTLLGGLVLFTLSEPFLFQPASMPEFQVRLVLPVLAEATPETAAETASLIPAVEITTILTITFFLLIQCLVYMVCLLKIREIDQSGAPSLVKLKLMENEDNLFDTGLYVGIAGTCISLVLQVLGFIEANLLAAYSSNLFGIMCVAIVKIRHVRPYKCQLIMESQSELKLVEA